MAMMQRGVEVNCKRCGKPALATEMVLDPVYRMMVCKRCVAERQLKDNPINTMKTAASFAKPQPKPVSQPAQPARKTETAAKTVTIQKTDKMKKKCSKCGFPFVYDIQKQYPQNCPNCGQSINSGYNFF
jgi:DNA-directed RNA polymerase subunit RPC12/RpoP